MVNALRVNAADLLRRAGTQKSIELQTALTELGIDDSARFAADAEVHVELHLESLTDGIVVDGALRVPWHGICRRCLVDTGGVQTSEVHELYQRIVTDPDAFELVGDQLDLRDAVRELVLLDVPTTPLCRPDCAGLCRTCGTNLNEGSCDCREEPADPRWAALDALKEEGARGADGG